MKWPLSRSRKSSSVMPEGVWEQYLAGQATQSTISMQSAVGLPAVLAVVRLIAHTAAMVPIEVLRGDGQDVRERARETWQWRLLERSPGPPPMTPFAFKADLAANFTGRGNAYVRKLKPTGQRAFPDSPRVTELMPLDASRITPKRQGGAVVFEDSTSGKPVTRGTDEIIQIRSFSVGGDGLSGVSPITAARMMISAGIKRNEFEDRHLANGIFPGMALKYPPSITQDQAKEWIDFLESRHQGVSKAGKIAAVGGGAELVPLPISLADAQFAEMTHLTLEQAAAMWQVPMPILLLTKAGATDDDWRHFITFALGPVLRSMCEAFTADRDLFDPETNADLTVEPRLSALLDLDPLKKAQVQREQIQTGSRLVDELRAQDGYGPLPAVPADWTQAPGKVPQITPVGGTPNPTASTSPGGLTNE